MYQRKHHTRSNRRSGKSAALLVSLLLLLTVTVGGTIAFLMDSHGPLQNLFNPSKVTTYVEETVSGGTKSNVSIKNTGDTEAWIRAAVVVTWKNAQDHVYGVAPVKGTDYTNWQPGAGWVAKDGFYYYTQPVAAGKTIESALIASIAPVSEPPADGYYLNVEIIGSGIQSVPESAVQAAWGVVPSTLK